MASGLGGFEPFFRESIDEMQAKATKRAAMLDALKKAESTPGQKNVGQRVIQWFTGERDLWGTRVNQTINRVRKMVPATVDQEALSLMRDFKSRPRELQQWLDGTHPNMPTDMDARDAAVKNIAKLRPAIERAMNPTKQMLEADKILTSIAEGSLREGRRIGFLESSISPDEYVTHILHPRGPDELASVPMTERMGRAMGGKIGRRFAYSAKRSYPTLLDAIADNVKPRTLNALDAFTIHGDKFATARASRMLVDHLKDSAMGKWGSRGQANIPADWVEIAPHAHPFQNLRAFVGEGGEPEIARQTLFVPKFIEEALRPITDPDYTSRIIGFARWRGFQAYTKAVQLGMSLFHATTENYMALANMGPKGWAEAIKADRDSDLFREQESDMVQHGGTSPIQGKTFEAYGALQPGSIPTWTDIWRSAPGIKQMDQIAAGITEFTFNNLQRRFKVMNYAMAKAAWMAEHPNASPLERSDAMHSIAKELNAVYGGIQWENAGWNRSTIEMARAIMLAPDWTFSNLFNLKYTMERGTPAGKMARAFWLRSIVGGLVATQMLSLLISRKPSPNPTMVYIGKDKDGKDIFQNVFFKGAPGDLVNLVNNVKDYGAVAGLARLMQGKFAPIPRTALQLTTNRNYLGQEIAPKGEGFWANTMADVNAALQGVSPVPLSFQNLKDMLIGPNSDQYTFPEFATTIFAGTPPKHVKPPGTPEEEAKKAASRKLGTYQPTIEGQRQMRARGNLVQRIKAGDPTVETEIDRQVAEGKLTPRQKANLYRLAAR